MSAAPAPSQGLRLMTDVLPSTSCTTDAGGGVVGSPLGASDIADLATLADLESHQDSDFLARLFLNEDEFPSLMDTTTASPSINSGLDVAPTGSMDQSHATLEFPCNPTPSPPLFSLIMAGFPSPPPHSTVAPPPPPAITNTNFTAVSGLQYHPANTAFPYLPPSQPKQHFSWNAMGVSGQPQSGMEPLPVPVAPAPAVYSRAPPTSFVASAAPPPSLYMKPDLDSMEDGGVPVQRQQPPTNQLPPPKPPQQPKLVQQFHPPPPPQPHHPHHHAQQPPSEDPRLQRRRDRNRESARACRRRKKEQFEQLQNKVDQLNQEVDTQRNQHLEAGLPTLQRIRNDLISQLEKRLAAPVAGTEGMVGSVTEVQQVVRTLLSKFGPFCEEKQTILLFHFLQLRNLLLPPHVQLTAWVMQQDEAFFKGERGQCSERASALKLGERHFHDGHTSCGQGLYLWPLLAYELQLRNEQIDRLRKAFAGLSSGQELSDDCTRMHECMRVLDEVEKGMMATARSLHKKMEKVEAVLTPQQLVKFKAWVERSKDQLGRLRSRAVATTLPNSSNNMDVEKLKSGAPPLELGTMVQLLDSSQESVPWRAATERFPLSLDLISSGSSQGDGSEEEDEDEVGEEDQENGAVQAGRGSGNTASMQASSTMGGKGSGSSRPPPHPQLTPAPGVSVSG